MGRSRPRLIIIARGLLRAGRVENRGIHSRGEGTESTVSLLVYCSTVRTLVAMLVATQYHLIGPSKQPIRTRYLGHMTDYHPIRDQYYLLSHLSNIPVRIIHVSVTHQEE